jgi:hypothetical protein
MSLITRGISIYREEGVTTLLLKAFQKIKHFTEYKLISVRGKCSLELVNHTVTFSAPNPTVVRRNQGRFNSEKSGIEDFIAQIEKADVVYDIGANTGLYTLFAAKACPKGGSLLINRIRRI